MAQTLQLAKHVKRVWLETDHRLTCASYFLYLYESTYQFKTQGENEWKKFLGGDLKLTFYFRDHPLIIHGNDMVSKWVSVQDFKDKVEQMNSIAKTAIEKVESDKDRVAFSIKEFLNPNEGCSEIYTSTMAVTSSHSHGYTFEISSCDHKTRITLHGRKAFLAFMKKLQNFLWEVVLLCGDILEEHGELLEHDHEVRVTNSAPLVGRF